MGQKDDKEREKTRRVETAKLCYNLCHSTLTITVLGNVASFFGIGNTTSEISLWFIIVGLVASLAFFIIGYNILKK